MTDTKTRDMTRAATRLGKAMACFSADADRVTADTWDVFSKQGPEAAVAHIARSYLLMADTLDEISMVSADLARRYREAGNGGDG